MDIEELDGNRTVGGIHMVDHSVEGSARPSEARRLISDLNIGLRFERVPELLDLDLRPEFGANFARFATHRRRNICDFDVTVILRLTWLQGDRLVPKGELGRAEDDIDVMGEV